MGGPMMGGPMIGMSGPGPMGGPFTPKNPYFVGPSASVGKDGQVGLVHPAKYGPRINTIAGPMGGIASARISPALPYGLSAALYGTHS